ncbi:class I SAM-dependent methyltransferase [Kitasatospora sp. NPDC057015]|uniref:class I SAM-dependent methyltransferase n=1 Tax=Kitasatospora sp. NPDC057015 TaxID=3346001 RepID=UPI00363B1716
MAHPAPQPHTPEPHGTQPHHHGHEHEHGHGQSHANDSHGSHGHRHPEGADPQDGLAEMLDLDAELFAAHLANLTERLAHLAGDGVTQVVDLGAGTGTGTFALLERFPAARVTAVDNSPVMLARLRASADARGAGDRVHTLETDAGTGLPGVTDADLVWASASLHHMDDPATALAEIRAALRPGGLLAVAELDGLPHFLPEDVVPERPGLEVRCRTALDALHAEQVPHLGADWRVLLTAAGFTVEEEHTEVLELRAPFPADAGRYAYLVLNRIRGTLDGRVDPVDLTALDALLDGGPGDVRHRDDLVVRSTRRTWTARRPADRP